MGIHMGEGGRRGAWCEVARGRSGGRAQELLVVSKKKINTKKAKKTRLTVAPDAGTSWSHGGEWGRGMRWPEGGWRGGTVARAPCQPVVTHVMPHRVAVEWRGVWVGVGSVTERTRVEKKERKARRTVMDGAGAANTGVHAMKGDGACKQSISALKEKKRKLITERKVWQVGE